MAQLASTTIYGDLVVRNKTILNNVVFNADMSFDSEVIFNKAVTFNEDISTNGRKIIFEKNDNSDYIFLSVGHLPNSISTYSWNFVYAGATQGDNGNELRFQSNKNNRYIQMDHLGNLEMNDGSGTYGFHSDNKDILKIANKTAIRKISDEWLRINDISGQFTQGTYFGSSPVRLDGELEIGANGATFNCSSTVFTYKGNKVYHAGNKPTLSELGAMSSAGGTMTGNLIIDSGTSTTLTVLCDDAGNATIKALGGNQGTGIIYVGQSETHGGGIKYNGDGTPATSGAGADFVTIYRRQDSHNYWTARNHVNDNDWEFRGDVYSQVNKKLATEEYVNTKTLTTTLTFTKGVDNTKTFTHNLGTTNYRVLCTSNSAERHVYFSNKLTNAVEIKLDDVPAEANIEVDVLLVKY